MNKYIFNGTIGNDAEVKEITNYTIISFNCAVNETWRDKQGNKQERTTWIKCTKFIPPNGSTKIADYLKKGQQVIIEGVPSARAYNDKNGVAQSSLEVKVDELTLIGKVNKSEPSESKPTNLENLEQTKADDLPF